MSAYRKSSREEAACLFVLAIVALVIGAGCASGKNSGLGSTTFRTGTDARSALDDARFYLQEKEYREAMKCLDEVRDIAHERRRGLPSGFDVVEAEVAPGYFAFRLKGIDRYLQRGDLDTALALFRVFDGEMGDREIVPDARHAARAAVLDAVRRRRESQPFVTMAHLESFQIESELLGDPTLVAAYEEWAAEYHRAEAERIEATMPHASFVHRMLHHYFRRTTPSPDLVAQDAARSNVTLALGAFEAVPACKRDAMRTRSAVRSSFEGAIDRPGDYPVEISGRWFSCSAETRTAQHIGKKYVTEKIPYSVPIKREVPIMGMVEYPCQTFKSISGRSGRHSVHRVASTCKTPGVVGVRTEVVGQETRYRYETHERTVTSTYKYDVVNTRTAAKISSPHEEAFAVLSQSGTHSTGLEEDKIALVLYQIFGREEDRVFEEANGLAEAPGGLNPAIDKLVRAVRLRQSLPLTASYRRALADARAWEKMSKGERTRFTFRVRGSNQRNYLQIEGRRKFARRRLMLSDDVAAAFDRGFGLTRAELELVLAGQVPPPRVLEPSKADPRARNAQCDRFLDRL